MEAGAGAALFSGSLGSASLVRRPPPPAHPPALAAAHTTPTTALTCDNVLNPVRQSLSKQVLFGLLLGLRWW